MRKRSGWLLLLFGATLLSAGIVGGVELIFASSGRSVLTNVAVLVAAIASLVVGIAVLRASRRQLAWQSGAFVSASSAMVVLMLALTVTAWVWSFTRTSKQKRTIGDMISLSYAIEAYSADSHSYPAAKSVDELATQLNPTYLRLVPRVDSWKHELRYERVVAADGKQTFYLGSAGGDGVWEHAHLSDYSAGATTDYDDDIIWKNQALSRYPQSLAWLANERVPAGR